MGSLLDGLTDDPEILALSHAERQGPDQYELAAHGASKGEFVKGLNRAIGGTVGGVQALGGTALEALGATEAGPAMTQRGLSTINNAQMYNPAAVGEFTDIGATGNYLRDIANYVPGVVGEMAPSVATAMIGGGIGGAVVNRVGGTVALRAAQQAATSAVVRDQITKKLARNALAGQFAGGTIGMFPQEAGEAAASYAADPELMADPDVSALDRLGMSVAKGGVNAALEAAVPVLSVNRIFGEAAKRVGKGESAKYIGKEVAKQLTGEALTEGAQQFTGDVAHNQLNAEHDWLDPKGILNAAAAGAVGGGVMGGAMSGIKAGIDRAADKTQHVRENPITAAMEAAGSTAAKFKGKIDLYNDNVEGKADEARLNELLANPTREDFVSRGINTDDKTPETNAKIQAFVAERRAGHDAEARARAEKVRDNPHNYSKEEQHRANQFLTGGYAKGKDYLNDELNGFEKKRRSEMLTRAADDLREVSGGRKQSKMRTTSVEDGSTRAILERAKTGDTLSAADQKVVQDVLDFHDKADTAEGKKATALTYSQKVNRALATLSRVPEASKEPTDKHTTIAMGREPTDLDNLVAEQISDNLIPKHVDKNSRLTQKQQEREHHLNLAEGLMRFVGSNFGSDLAKDGQINVPESVVRAFASPTDAIDAITKVYDTLRGQGHIENDAATRAKLAEVVRDIKLHDEMQGSGAGTVERALTPLARSKIEKSLAPAVSRAIGTGTTAEIKQRLWKEKMNELSDAVRELTTKDAGKGFLSEYIAKTETNKTLENFFGDQTNFVIDAHAGQSKARWGKSPSDMGIDDARAENDKSADGDTDYDSADFVRENHDGTTEIVPSIRITGFGDMKDGSNRPFAIMKDRGAAALNTAREATGGKEIGAVDLWEEAHPGKPATQDEALLNEALDRLDPAHAPELAKVIAVREQMKDRRGIPGEKPVPMSPMSLSEAQRKAIVNYYNAQHRFIRNEDTDLDGLGEAIKDLRTLKAGSDGEKGEFTTYKHGRLVLERAGGKTFETTTGHMIKAANTAADREGPGAVEGASAKGSSATYDRMLAGLSAVLTKPGTDFTGRVGWRTSPGGRIKYMEKGESLPYEMALFGATVRQAEKQKKWEAGSEKAEFDPETASTSSDSAVTTSNEEVIQNSVRREDPAGKAPINREPDGRAAGLGAGAEGGGYGGNTRGGSATESRPGDSGPLPVSAPLKAVPFDEGLHKKLISRDTGNAIGFRQVEQGERSKIVATFRKMAKAGVPEAHLAQIGHMAVFTLRKSAGTNFGWLESDAGSAIGLNAKVFHSLNPAYPNVAAQLQFVLTHELGHGIDIGYANKATLSTDQTFAIEYANGAWKAEGAVAKEMLKVSSDPTNPLRPIVEKTPFNGEITDAARAQREMFAQAYALYFTQRTELAAYMPATFAHMENLYGTEGQSVQAAAAADRTGVGSTLRSPQKDGAGRNLTGRSDQAGVHAGRRTDGDERSVRDDTGHAELTAYVNAFGAKNSVWAGGARRALKENSAAGIKGSLASAKKQFGALPATNPLTDPKLRNLRIALKEEEGVDLNSVAEAMAFADNVAALDKAWQDIERDDGSTDNGEWDKHYDVGTAASHLAHEAGKWLSDPNDYVGTDFAMFFDGIKHTAEDVEQFVRKMADKVVKVRGNYIDVLDIRPDLQGRGAGRNELFKIESSLRTRGHKEAHLLAKPESVGFWEKMGYTAGKPGEGGNVPMVKTLGAKQSKQATNAQKPDPTANAPLTEDEKAALQADVVRRFGEGKIELKLDHLFGVKEGTVSGEYDPAGIIKLALGVMSAHGTLAHESLHGFFKMLATNGSPETRALLERVANNPIIKRKMERLLNGHPDAVKQLEDPEERVAYMFQFFITGELELGPETEGLFNKVKVFLSWVMHTLRGTISDEAMARKVLEAFEFGVMKDDAVMKAFEQNITDNTAKLKAANSLVDVVGKVVGKQTFSAKGVMKLTKNKEMIALANEWARDSWETTGGTSFYEDFRRFGNIHMNKLEKIFSGYDKADLALAMEGLQAGKEPTDRIAKEIYKEVHAHLETLHKFMQTNKVMRRNEENTKWEKFGWIEDYFPRVWDVENIQANAGKFKEKLLTIHAEALAVIAKQANNEVRAGKGAGELTASQNVIDATTKELITPEMVADAIIERIQSTMGMEQPDGSESETSHSPLMRNVNRRTLTWLDKEAFAEFQNKDLLHTLTSYTHQAVKRAVFTKHFGNAGVKIDDQVGRAHALEIGGDALSAKVTRRLEKARDEWEAEPKGPEPTFMTVMRKVLLEQHIAKDATEAQQIEGAKKVREMTDAAEKKLADAVYSIRAMEGVLGKDIDPSLRKALSWATTYESWRLLTTTLFTSINDVAGIVVRGGDLDQSWKAFVRGIKEVKKTWANDFSKDEWATFAERIGTATAHTNADNLGQTYNSIFMSGAAQKWNDRLFHWNGLRAWDRAMRVQATVAAVSYIEKLSAGGKDSKRLMEELYGAGNKAKTKADGTLDLDDPANQVAVARWVGSAIITPDASQRTGWMSNPYFILFSHLKNYTYSFHQQMIKRVWNEAAVHGNYDPALKMAMMYIPIAIAADAFKELILPTDAAWTKGGLVDYLQHGVARSGLGGIPQLYGGYAWDQATMFKDRPSGDNGALGFAGPLPNQIYNAFMPQFMGGEAWSQFGEGVAGALPGGTVLRRVHRKGQELLGGDTAEE